MIRIRRSADRGHADHGWLNAYHTFSFANYYDPEHMGFSVLRVINQDRVAPGKGFATHGHRDMEIVTYVLEGVLEHKDNMGNGSQMRPGEVQLMSAGSGVTHSEFNASEHEGLHLLQMWILPREEGTTPRYEQRTFETAERQDRLRLVVSPDGAEGSLTIGQDVRLFAALLAPGARIQHQLDRGRSYWLHLAKGQVRWGEELLRAGDGLAISGEAKLELEGAEDADMILWDLPPAH